MRKLIIMLAVMFAMMADADEVKQPEIINVFVGGEEDIEGVENAATQYPKYREQNITVTKNGRIVVVCQARHESRHSDRSGQDLVCKWSDDNGRTWTKGKMIVTHGLHSICPNASVYDAEKDRIHVLYNLFPWSYQKGPKSIKGEKESAKQKYCLQYVITSDDQGKTWSKPRDISDMIDTKGAIAVFGSGEGIQLKQGKHKGRLIIAGGDFYEGKKVLCYYSDDHGKTWKRSKTVPAENPGHYASETKVAELPDGTLILNSRTSMSVIKEDKLMFRTRSFSKDGGVTWSDLKTNPALKAVSCNGSLISVKHSRGEDGAILLCSVPVGPGRTHGTVYVSFDGGMTWPHKKLVIEDTFAYSSLMQLADGKIGLFYESRGIVLARFGLEWLLGK